MQVFLTPQQSSFFAKNKYIELEMILSEDELHELKENGEKLLSKRLKTTPEKLVEKPSLDLFKEGRDLWTDDVKAKRSFIPAHLVKLAARLFQADALRVGFTHFLITGEDNTSPIPKSPIQLKEICSFNDAPGAVIIKLDDTPSITSELCPLPKTFGSALFIRGDYPFSFDLLYKNPGQRFYLILFAPQRAVYILQKNDPLTHQLKKSGYAFGDFLQEETHPLFFKSTH